MSKKKVSSSLAFELPVLDSKCYSYEKLNRIWKDGWKHSEADIQNFIELNSKRLAFLKIEAVGKYDINGKYSLNLYSSRFAGCIPLLSPTTGLPFGNLSVTSRFGEDISELLSLVGDVITPEYDEQIRLNSNDAITPPVYLECLKFIDKYIEAQRYRWRKFSNGERIENRPSSSTNWAKYAILSANPLYSLKYNNKKNLLSYDHPEWRELSYVLNLAIEVVNSSRTPLRSRTPYFNKILSLTRSLEGQVIEKTNGFNIHMSDPQVIKELKVLGNNIIKNDSSSLYAWRIDFAAFFEKYVQFLLKNVAFQRGASISTNRKYPINGKKPAWGLAYLEPDIVIQKDKTQYIVDAKYKAHMFNIENSVEDLKESFRKDLHQVLAYSSFSNQVLKHVILIYPCNVYKEVRMKIESSISTNSCEVILVGISLKKSEVPDIQEKLFKLISF